nr:hypothetical protein [uncultured Mediterranean phage uvMED]
MDEQTLENWRRIRAHLQKVGSTDNHFYRRAVAITDGKPDPFKTWKFNPPEQ